MILTAHSFLPSLAEMRLGWGLAVPRTRSVRASWCFPLREAIRPDRSGTCTWSNFPDNLESDLEFDRTLISRESILFSVRLLTPPSSISRS